MNFDQVSSLIQLLTFAALAIWAVRSAMRRSLVWLYWLIFGAFTCFVLGNAFWILHISIAGDWPSGFSCADLSYIGFYCFLLSAQTGIIHGWTSGQRQAAEETRSLALIAPAVVILFHAVYYFVAGGLFSNIVYGAVLSVFSYYTCWAFLAGLRARVMFPLFSFHAVIIVALVLALLVFLVSSFGWDNVYYALSFAGMIVLCTLPRFTKDVTA